MAALEASAHRIMGLRNIVDFFLAPSGFLRRKMIDRGFSLEKVKHLPLFLPDKMFNKGNRNRGYLLYLSRLEPIKGILSILKACRLVPEINLVIAGPVREPLSSQLPELLPFNAKYVGMKQGSELRRILFESSAVVHPSLLYENQPFSIMEAFAAGKPVIASDLGGMTELVKNSRGGLLVPPGDIEALADAMQWMIIHPREANRMGMKAREYAHEEYNAEGHYQRLMKIYKQLW